MIVLPVMPVEQTASWIGLLDLYDRLSDGWTLIGGQLVHLHCAERGRFPIRPTNDADTVIDVRADPTILHTFIRTLTDLGFTSAGISPEGRQHRWVRDQASIDVLLPEGIGERASERRPSYRRSRPTASFSWRCPRQLSRSTDSRYGTVGSRAPTGSRRLDRGLR